MNTTETNKKLAEFLGFELSHKIERVPNNEIFKEHINLITDNADNLPFHNDWNWLMTVIEKIESLGYCVDIKLEYCRIVPQGKPNEYIVKFGEGDNKFEATYNACSMFVDWYNNQKP